MKTPERFDRAIKALVQAFFNDTLAKGDCEMCAVGNICGGHWEWKCVFFTDTTEEIQHMWIDNYYGRAKAVIDSTGYSVKELAMIEKAFEGATKIGSVQYKAFDKSAIMNDQYNGLMAVVEVLCEIEGLNSEEYKQAFAYTEDLKPVHSI